MRREGQFRIYADSLLSNHRTSASRRIRFLAAERFRVGPLVRLKLTPPDAPEKQCSIPEMAERADGSSVREFYSPVDGPGIRVLACGAVLWESSRKGKGAGESDLHPARLGGCPVATGRARAHLSYDAALAVKALQGLDEPCHNFDRQRRSPGRPRRPRRSSHCYARCFRVARASRHSRIEIEGPPDASASLRRDPRVESFPFHR